MPTRQTSFVDDCYYHIFNRGSEKRTIFLSDDDYNKFIERMKENAKKYNINILCYCLMPNHFHLLLKQSTDGNLVDFMNAVQLGHAKFFNIKYQRVGPLFQGRFKAKYIPKDEYLLHLSAYIHRNPVAKYSKSLKASTDRLMLQELLRSFQFSSYRQYIGLTSSGISTPTTILSYFSHTNPKLSYESFVENFIPDLEALAPISASIY